MRTVIGSRGSAKGLSDGTHRVDRRDIGKLSNRWVMTGLAPEPLREAAGDRRVTANSIAEIRREANMTFLRQNILRYD